MSIRIYPTTREAYQLFHEGSLALAEAEYNGICVDRAYCESKLKASDRLHKLLTKQISESDLGVVWKKKYNRYTDFGSSSQLEDILFNVLGLASEKKSKSGLHESINATALLSTNLAGAKLLVERKQIEKNCDYLRNMLVESEHDGKIHPFFNLTRSDFTDKGGARSYRGSSDSPNFQNFPKRHGSSAKLVRTAITPRIGHRIVGRDYEGVEVCSSVCNHQDPTMLRYLEEGNDMHKDVAAMCFKLPPELCSKAAGKRGKDIRFVGKNSFTFAQFYFQEPENSARGLWRSISDMDLRYPPDEEKTIFQHLADHGISNYNAFENHIREVCKEFWTSLFPGYGRWRVKHLAEYEKKGYIDYLTGFRVEGVLTKYQLGNYPIQGPAFHILLKALIETLKWWKSKPNWRSKLIGQIHDELTTDEHDEEFDENEAVISRIMTVDIKKAWDWVITPLRIETSFTGIGGHGGNWYTKGER
jgi:DNA polymerase I-like protein with 3'-5' exonuclease and polymerase domains